MSKRSGTRCKRAASVGRQTCRMHGGASPRGLAHPRLRHGRYSRSLPTRLATHYEAALQDPNLLALIEEIHLVDARLDDLVRRVDSGESGQIWREAKAALTAFEDANLRGDIPDARVAMDRLERLIKHGLSDEAAWSDVRTMIDQRRKLVESERKRLVEAQHMVHVGEVMTLVQALTTAVQRHVHDPQTLHAVVREIEQLVNWDPPAGLGGPGGYPA